MNKKTIDWTRIIEDQKNSGLTITKYCKENNLSEYTFKYHKYSSPKILNEPLTMIPVVCDAPKNVSFKLNGVSIEVSSNIDDQMLRKIARSFL